MSQELTAKQEDIMLEQAREIDFEKKEQAENEIWKEVQAEREQEWREESEDYRRCYFCNGKCEVDELVEIKTDDGEKVNVCFGCRDEAEAEARAESKEINREIEQERAREVGEAINEARK